MFKLRATQQQCTELHHRQVAAQVLVNAVASSGACVCRYLPQSTSTESLKFVCGLKCICAFHQRLSPMLTSHLAAPVYLCVHHSTQKVSIAGPQECNSALQPNLQRKIPSSTKSVGKTANRTPRTANNVNYDSVCYEFFNHGGIIFVTLSSSWEKPFKKLWRNHYVKSTSQAGTCERS